MAQYGFGAGYLWAIPSGSNPTPVLFGALQNASVDFASTIKPLFGSQQLPLTQARGTMNVSGKATLAQFSGRLISQIFFNDNLDSGQLIAAYNEPHAVPGTSTYTITVTNAADYVMDLGVTYAATGLPLTRVASVAAVGEYSVNESTGVYTFYSGDASANVKISYEYTSTDGESVIITNQAMGEAPNFSTVLSIPYAGEDFNLTLNACVAGKMTFTTSLEDFTKQDFEFGAFVDSSNTLGTMSFAEAS